ncbi:hypothetical protein TNCV_648551 [Trichonephila clavipes]|uniref:Uncharacterized protein n=1 Tax=Trichonephila clavipes TaxID=2585209 RepID=A0A8X6VDW4_TRICX|nr:hypothetical protein TNCV_648551 [Trichonephila clavipes]
MKLKNSTSTQVERSFRKMAAPLLHGRLFVHVPNFDQNRNLFQSRPLHRRNFHAEFKPLHRTATAGSDVVQTGRPIFDDFFQHLWPYIGNNTANVVFQMVKRLWLIRIDQ